MTFGAAISEHPVTAQATGEVVGQVLEQVGEAPDLAVLFVTNPHLGLMAEIAETVRTVLRPGTLVGATASSIVGGPREVEEGPAISLWAGRVGPAKPIRLQTQRLNGGWALSGLPACTEEDTHRMLVLLTDPFTFPADAMPPTTRRPGHPGATGWCWTTGSTPTGPSGSCSTRRSCRRRSSPRAAGRSGSPTS